MEIKDMDMDTGMFVEGLCASDDLKQVIGF